MATPVSHSAAVTQTPSTKIAVPSHTTLLLAQEQDEQPMMDVRVMVTAVPVRSSYVCATRLESDDWNISSRLQYADSWMLRLGDVIKSSATDVPARRL